MAPSSFPLFERFPKLVKLPRARLCTLPSPVERLTRIPGHSEIWMKRDDLDAPVCGGNKARALEFLLGGLGPGDTVLTVGGQGSTHVLSTALHAARLGVATVSMRWAHDMNPVAEIVSSRIAAVGLDRKIRRSTLLTLARARLHALSGSVHYIPVGGSVPLGVLGHVNAALELTAQIDRGEMPAPEQIVIALASGGTVAGLLLGFAIAGLRVEVVGARVGPRVVVNRQRVLRLARQTSKLIEKVSGERPPRIDPSALRIVHHVYGGGYGRALPSAKAAAAILHDAAAIRLDDTYSGKAWVAALDEARTSKGPVLFWLTFDPSCLTS
ncbi:MAG: pyridoxal-phosphate dependent enzyme [Gemmatimonadales bacterium]